MKTVKLLFCIIVFAFSFSFCKGQSWVWASEAHSNAEGGDPTQTDHNVYADNFGNAFVTGIFMDTLSFGSDTLISPNYLNSTYIVKYSNKGKAEWARQSENLIVNVNNRAYGYAISTDGMGNVITTGFFTGSILFGTDTLKSSGYGEIFTVKYDSSGNFKWAKQSHEAANAVIVSNAIIADEYGNSFVTGWFEGTVILGNDTLIALTSTQGSDEFLVKYNPSGNVVWAKQTNQSSALSLAMGNSIALNKNNEIFVAGLTRDTIFFDTNELKSNLIGAMFIVKYDSLGNIIWLRQSYNLSKSSGAQGYSLAIDGLGMIYVTGGFVDSAIFGNDTLISLLPKKDYNIFLVKYDLNGNLIWAVQSSLMSPISWASFSVACDTLKRGGCYMGVWNPTNSSISNSLGFPGDTINLTTKLDYSAEAVLKFDSSGKAMCGVAFSEGIEDDGDGLNVDPSGEHVYFYGDLADTAIFGNDTLPCNRKIAELPFLACWRPCDAPTLGIMPVKTNEYLVKVFPNPSSGKFTIQLSGISGQCSVEVYNVLGEKVFSNYQITKSSNYQIDLSSNPNGVYLYCVISENGTIAGEGKFVIEH